MVHNFKKFDKSIVGKCLKEVKGKEYKDDYGKMPELKTNKKKIMAKTNKAILGMILFTFMFLFIGLVGAVTIYSDDNDALKYVLSNVDITEYTNSSILFSSNDYGVTKIGNSSVQVYNQTWLEFDGVDDYVLIESDSYDTVTFWYQNSTSDWIFVANVSGTTYVDGSTDTPNEYPLYFNGTHYVLGMTNDSTYWEGNIDDFRVLNYTSDSELIELIYGDGRL